MSDCCLGPCEGGNLDRLLQPAILTALAPSDGLHGYELDRQLGALPMMRGRKPDLAGVYRLLKRMEERGLIASDWDMAEAGPPKRVYVITDSGLDCLGRWVRTLRDYAEALVLFVGQARAALEAVATGAKCNCFSETLAKLEAGAVPGTHAVHVDAPAPASEDAANVTGA
jgi:DNA-binding PadR family transcriptional regulator